MRSTAEVLARHLQCFADRDLDGTMADYSTGAVFFSTDGTLRGPVAIREVLPYEPLVYLNNSCQNVSLALNCACRATSGMPPLPTSEVIAAPVGT